jgi:hypothetical protein
MKDLIIKHAYTISEVINKAQSSYHRPEKFSSNEITQMVKNISICLVKNEIDSSTDICADKFYPVNPDDFEKIIQRFQEEILTSEGIKNIRFRSEEEYPRVSYIYDIVLYKSDKAHIQIAINVLSN